MQPRLEFCRTCHVPGGVADVPDGHEFMLTPTRSQDLADVRTNWERLGGNNPTSRILLMSSGAETPHSGGAPWPTRSDAYLAMDLVLKCFADTQGCDALLAGVDPAPVVEELPLLGSTHALHVWDDFCDGNDDAATLPPDPRSLIRPGINPERAVFFNAYWEDCHVNLPAHQQQVRTCCEYRQRSARGLDFMLDELSEGSTTAASYNTSWQRWGLTERPDNFDELYTLRYGLNRAPFHNPYPLPGEDPNETDGGSGQLPLGLRQRRDAEGRWNGSIGSAACFLCHGGQIGEPNIGESVFGIEHLGLGNNNYDVLVAGRDGSPFGDSILSTWLPPLDIYTLFNIGITQRGQNNAVGAFEFLITILDLDSLGVNPNPLKTMVGTTGVQDMAHPLAHTQDTPAWWNFGSRPRKFFDAGVSSDSTRIIMAAGGISVTPDGKAYRDRIEEYDRDVEA